MKSAKLSWSNSSVYILLTEYKKMKPEFDKLSFGSGRKQLWEELRKRLAEKGVFNRGAKNIMKKFFSLKKNYKDYLEGHSVKHKLYGFENLLKDLLESDPYFSARKSQQRSLDLLKTEGASRDLPSWVIHLSRDLKKAEKIKKESLWALQQDVAYARKKKVDALEALIRVLRNDNGKVDETPDWVHSQLLRPIRVISEDGIIEKPVSETVGMRTSHDYHQLSPLKDESLKEYELSSLYEESPVRTEENSNETQDESDFSSVDTNCLQLISVPNQLV